MIRYSLAGLAVEERCLSPGWGGDDEESEKEGFHHDCAVFGGVIRSTLR
jgi:hypothetical protein